MAKLSLCLINGAPRHESVWGSGGIALSFTTSALEGDVRLALRPYRSNPGETFPGTHWSVG
jgi:hypothetical protein